MFQRIHSHRKARSGFTLVELLVVVLIITVLATIVLFAMFASTEAARKARTRSMISRIHDLLLPMWESYRTRRVPITIPPNTGPQAAAGLRVDALRELMRMELPDRKSDVIDPPVNFRDPPTNSILMPVPSLTRAYRRHATQLAGGNIANWDTAHQGSECLYLILARIQDGDTNGLEFLRETEIGDLDQDGLPEILDGWGTPVRLLRWPAGFTSNVALTGLQKDPANADPDPFDPLGVRGTPPNTYYLFPLVISAGPDRAWDILMDGRFHDGSTVQNAGLIRYSRSNPGTSGPWNDPFATEFEDTGGSTVTLPARIGAPNDNNDTNGGTPDEHIDNIHNHLLSIGAQ